MANYKLPKTFNPAYSPTQKPTVPVEIDWSNDLTRNLYYSTLFHNSANIVDGTVYELGSTASLDRNTFNPTDGSSNSYLKIPDYDYVGAGVEGLSAVVDFEYSGQLNEQIIQQGNSQFNGNLNIYNGTSGTLTVKVTANLACTVSGVSAGDRVFLVVSATVRSGTTSGEGFITHAWVNGVYQTDSITNDLTFDAITDTAHIGNTHDGSKAYSRPIYQVSLYDRTLSYAEALALYQAPYSIYKPVIEPVYYTAGSGTASPTPNTYNHIATGGITTGGIASVNVERTVDSSGGITTGGAATTSLSPAGTNVYNHTSTGGITTGGTAVILVERSIASTGGITTGGVAEINSVHNYTSSGGITTGGTADAALVPAGTNVYSYTSTGGITTGGSANVIQLKNYTGSGQVDIGGSAVTEHSPVPLNTYNHTSTGGITTAGTADIVMLRDYLPSGGITVSGAADTSRTGEATLSTLAQQVEDLTALVNKLIEFHGLDPENPHTISRTSRTSNNVNVSITENGDGSVTLQAS